MDAMKTSRNPGMLVYSQSPREFIFGSNLASRSVEFDSGAAAVRLQGWFPFKTAKTIPFRAIRRVRHAVVAPIEYYQDSNSWYSRRSYTQRTEILLDLVNGEAERLYRFGWGLHEGAFRILPASRHVAMTQVMTEEIARIIGKPIRIDVEEAEISMDFETKEILFTGEYLTLEIRGSAVPFDQVRALLFIKRPDGYIASRIVKKTGEVIPTMHKYASQTDLDETLRLVAQAAGLPFELDETRLPSSCPEPSNRPIRPE
jgi:hypothetical protein